MPKLFVEPVFKMQLWSSTSQWLLKFIDIKPAVKLTKYFSVIHHTNYTYNYLTVQNRLIKI